MLFIRIFKLALFHHQLRHLMYKYRNVSSGPTNFFPSILVNLKLNVTFLTFLRDDTGSKTSLANSSDRGLSRPFFQSLYPVITNVFISPISFHTLRSRNDVK